MLAQSELRCGDCDVVMEARNVTRHVVVAVQGEAFSRPLLRHFWLPQAPENSSHFRTNDSFCPEM
jgi:hypothetical protein